MLRFVLFLIFTIAAYQPASAAVVRVANGDCAGLSTAIMAAAQGAESTTILLARNGNYSGCSVGADAGAIIIDGQGSLWQGGSICAGQPSSTGTSTSVSMTLRNMTLTPSTDGTVPSGCPLNFGGTTGGFMSCSVLAAVGSSAVLNLETMTLRGFGYAVCNFFVPISVIDSSGSLSLRNVTATDISGTLINSDGVLDIYNSTFVNNAPLNPYLQSQLPLFSSSSTGGSSGKRSVRVANSLFAANTGPVCDSGQFSAIAFDATSSRGGNVSDSANCGFSAANGDKVIPDAQLGSFGDHGGLIPTQALAYGSVAHGVGMAQYCEALDARGYTRATNTCDAGAYEYGGGSGALTANGMNGVYYDPAANGHYVSIQRIHDNGDVLVIWNTFDNMGNPAWIYGVGQIADKHIHAAMSQNLGGVLQVGGPAVGSAVRSWGAVDIDLSTCLLAQFNYQSGLPEFGSGQFPLTRLAIVADFGCSD